MTYLWLKGTEQRLFLLPVPPQSCVPCCGELPEGQLLCWLCPLTSLCGMPVRRSCIVVPYGICAVNSIRTTPQLFRFVTCFFGNNQDKLGKADLLSVLGQTEL